MILRNHPDETACDLMKKNFELSIFKIYQIQLNSQKISSTLKDVFGVARRDMMSQLFRICHMAWRSLVGSNRRKKTYLSTETKEDRSNAKNSKGALPQPEKTMGALHWT